MTSLRIAFAGTPQFALPALRAGLSSAHGVVGVLTQPDRPAGRGRELRSPPVKLLALDAGLPLAQPEKFMREEPTPLAASPAIGRPASTAAPAGITAPECRVDREALLKLDYEAFEHDIDGGWRPLGAVKLDDPAVEA